MTTPFCLRLRRRPYSATSAAFLHYELEHLPLEVRPRAETHLRVLRPRVLRAAAEDQGDPQGGGRAARVCAAFREDSLSKDQNYTLEVARIFREGFLQQNGIIEYDCLRLPRRPSACEGYRWLTRDWAEGHLRELVWLQDRLEPIYTKRGAVGAM